MSFKVGDRVRIRQWDDMENEFGTDVYGNIMVRLRFIPSMKYLCGKDAVITNINERYDYYNLNVGEAEDLVYAFSDEMLEKAESDIEKKEGEKVKENMNVYINKGRVILRTADGKTFISKNHNEEFNLEKGILMNILKMKGFTHSWIKNQFEKANGDLEFAYMRLLVLSVGINNDVVEELVKNAVNQDKKMNKSIIYKSGEVGVKAKVLQKAKYIGKGKKFKPGEIITCIDINKHGTCVFSNGRKEEPLNTKGYVIINEDN